MYGGAAGGGKSSSAVAFPLKWAHLHGMRSLILRRQSKDLDDIIHKSWDLYPTVCPGASKVQSPHYRWTFPSGAEVTLSHCNNEDDWKSYDGWEINLLIFDELTHFTEQQYTFLIGRNRSSRPGLPVYVRATTNPGGTGHEWVFKRWSAWLNPNFKARGLPERSDEGGRLPPAKPGEIWHVYLDDDGQEVYSREPVFNPDGTPKTLSRTFIPAMLADNQHADPKYGARVSAIPDRVRRLQLRDGNWLVKTVEGALFKGVQRFTRLPSEGGYGIAYGADLAYTASTKADWSVLLRGYIFDSDIYIVGMERKQVEATSFVLTMKAKLTERRGIVRWYIGGGGEKGTAQFISKHLCDANNRTYLRALGATADKLVRATPVASTWNVPTDDEGKPIEGKRGHIFVPGEDSELYGEWVDVFLNEVLSFTGDPKKDDHDDIVDALAALHDELCNTQQAERDREKRSRFLPTMS
ncbi:MAG: phage terminase large subunit [Methanomassiliicoccales archaeon]|nr:phage terminase large subunit [Methanomassiliicoccales archaeon]